MRVVIDPGHGGRDVGASVGGRTEAEIVLPYAFTLAAELVGRGYECRFTRMSNEDLAPEATWPKPGKGRDMDRRVSMANAARADVFISIHANAAAAAQAEGAWVIFDDDTREGDELAAFIFGEMAKIPGIPDRDPKPEVYPDNSPWVGERELWVVSQTNMPAVLVELGFLTNVMDLEQLEQMETKFAVAKAIADGIDRWEEARPKRAA